MTLLVNVTPLISALERSASRVDLATAAAASAGAAVFAEKIRQELGRTSHSTREPTPSQPGEPPARMTGQLQSSVRVFVPRRFGPGRYEGAAGPDDFIARFHEKGTHHERPHPFLERAVHGAELQVHAAVEKAWAVALNL